MDEVCARLGVGVSVGLWLFCLSYTLSNLCLLGRESVDANSEYLPEGKVVDSSFDCFQTINDREMDMLLYWHDHVFT